MRELQQQLATAEQQVTRTSLLCTLHTWVLYVLFIHPLFVQTKIAAQSARKGAAEITRLQSEATLQTSELARLSEALASAEIELAKGSVQVWNIAYVFVSSTHFQLVFRCPQIKIASSNKGSGDGSALLARAQNDLKLQSAETAV